MRVCLATHMVSPCHLEIPVWVPAWPMPSPTPPTRPAAQARSAPGQLLGLLHVSLDAGMDPSVRQVAAIAFKNSVKEGWGGEEEEAPALVSPEEKGAVRDAMFAGLVAAPSAVKKQLRESAKTMVYADYPAAWPTLLTSIGEGLVSQARRRKGGGVAVAREAGNGVVKAGQRPRSADLAGACALHYAPPPHSLAGIRPPPGPCTAGRRAEHAAPHRPEVRVQG